MDADARLDLTSERDPVRRIRPVNPIDAVVAMLLSGFFDDTPT